MSESIQACNLWRERRCKMMKRVHVPPKSNRCSHLQSYSLFKLGNLPYEIPCTIVTRETYQCFYQMPPYPHPTSIHTWPTSVGFHLADNPPKATPICSYFCFFGYCTWTAKRPKYEIFRTDYHAGLSEFEGWRREDGIGLRYSSWSILLCDLYDTKYRTCCLFTAPAFFFFPSLEYFDKRPSLGDGSTSPTITFI